MKSRALVVGWFLRALGLLVTLVLLLTWLSMWHKDVIRDSAAPMKWLIEATFASPSPGT